MVLFSLGDQQANKYKYFEPSELALRAQDTFKLDKVDWMCHFGHYVKGVAEGKAKPCGECDQTYDNKIEGFLTSRLRGLARDIEEGYDKLHREDREKAPPAIKYTVFLTFLFSSHGQGMLHPEAVSSKRKCLVQ